MAALNEVVLQSADGDVPLPSLWREKITVLVLLRHFGCPVCREHLLVTAEIAEQITQLGAQVVAVGQGFGAEAGEFARSIGIRFPCLGDPHNALYRALEIPRGSWWQVTLGPLLREPIKGIKRFRHVGKPGHDVQQLGGVAIIDTRGRVSYCYKARDSGDMPSNETLLAELRKVVGR